MVMLTESLMFGSEFERKVDAIVAKYPQPKAALLPVLWEVQNAKGAIDLEAEAWVASRLGVAPSHVHGCVTFYSMYKQKPSGRHHIQLCTTLSCMLRGSDELMRHLEHKLGIKDGETTPDGKFSLVRVECLGSCGTAPMFQLNDTYYENLTIAAVDRLLASLE
jgi:NADH-quinone oxidoreductase subunit E